MYYHSRTARSPRNIFPARFRCIKMRVQEAVVEQERCEIRVERERESSEQTSEKRKPLSINIAQLVTNKARGENISRGQRGSGMIINISLYNISNAHLRTMYVLCAFTWTETRYSVFRFTVVLCFVRQNNISRALFDKYFRQTQYLWILISQMRAVASLSDRNSSRCSQMILEEEVYCSVCISSCVRKVVRLICHKRGMVRLIRHKWEMVRLICH